MKNDMTTLDMEQMNAAAGGSKPPFGIGMPTPMKEPFKPVTPDQIQVAPPNLGDAIIIGLRTLGWL